MIKKRVAEFRTLPDNKKGLEEKRNDLVEEMENIISGAKEEVRALSDEEEVRFSEIEKEINGIDALIVKEAATRALGAPKKITEDKKEKEERTQGEINNQELRDIFTGNVAESRAAMNTITGGEGGFVVNEELSGTIIKAIKDRSNVYNFFNSTSVKGNLRIPKQASSGVAEWVTENPDTDPTASIPTLEIIELGQNRLYRESAITKQMLNVQELNLQGFITDDISDTMADAIEDAIFNGDGADKPTGIIRGISSKKKVSLENRGEFSVDVLKKCKAKLKKSIIKKARWFMNAETFLEIDLLKDTMGRPLLQPNIAGDTDYILLGLPVELTDAMPTIATTGAACLIVLATPEAYHTNTQKAISLYVYDDSVYTRRGLVGFGSDVYLDGKIKDEQQAAGIFNKSV
ncbi:MAG: phage major capsid protein [Clostridium sp.]